MSILSDLFNAGTGGVLTGLIGSIVTSITNYRLQKLNNQHEIAKIEAETNAMIAEAKANIEITETKVQGDLAISENQIFSETIRQSGRRQVSNELIAKLFDSRWTSWLGSLLVLLLGIVDVLKSAIRPTLTIYLIGVTTWITFTAYTILQLHNNAIDVDQALQLFNDVVNIVIYLTVSCVTWWFGDRRTAKFLYRLNDGNFRK